jgi:hypothetical protein
MEALAGKRTAVEDPILGFIQAQQPPEAAIQFQRGLLDHLRLSVNL